jgi:hypothetical protein
MTIDTSGNVGIGATPSSILDIRGSGDVSIQAKLINTGQTTQGRESEFLFGKDNGSNLSGVLKYYYSSTAANRKIVLEHYLTGKGITIPSDGSILHNGMKTVRFSFYIGLNAATNFDIPITNTIQYFEIKAIIGYYPGGSYTADIHGLYAYRSDSGVGRVVNWSDNSSSNSGSWSVSNPNTTTLRITKNAGASSGGARGFVEVKYQDV